VSNLEKQISTHLEKLPDELRDRGQYLGYKLPTWCKFESRFSHVAVICELLDVPWTVIYRLTSLA